MFYDYQIAYTFYTPISVTFAVLLIWYTEIARGKEDRKEKKKGDKADNGGGGAAVPGNGGGGGGGNSRSSPPPAFLTISAPLPRKKIFAKLRAKCKEEQAEIQEQRQYLEAIQQREMRFPVKTIPQALSHALMKSSSYNAMEDDTPTREYHEDVDVEYETFALDVSMICGRHVDTYKPLRSGEPDSGYMWFAFMSVNYGPYAVALQVWRNLGMTEGTMGIITWIVFMLEWERL